MHATPTDLLRRWQTEGPRPRTIQAVIEWVAWALRSQKPDEAAAILRQLLALKEHPALWGFLAQAETAAGRHDQAAIALVQHLKCDPNPQPAVYVAAVDAFVEAGRKDRALKLAGLAPGKELRAFLLQRLKQDTGRAPKPKAPKTLAALAKLDRNILMSVLNKLPVEVLGAALGGEPEPVREAILDCFAGGPRRRLVSLLGRKLPPKERAAAKKALLAAAR